MSIGNFPLNPDAEAEAEAEAMTQTFRNAMASLAATACVVTAAEGRDRLGRTVTAVFSLGIEPPAILVSIQAGSDLAAMIRRQGGFSFAMLQDDQQDVSLAFAGRVAAAQRFQHGDWAAWPSGHPRLRGAVASMDCTLGGEMETAGHILFIGHPQRIDLDEARKPLIWHNRGFTTVQPL